ncbi:MAG: TonB-dependent receptor, partial [Acidobacteria bacterium]|nr:TonB-dependent receptor [Acidobacteriota bacterium]
MFLTFLALSAILAPGPPARAGEEDSPAAEDASGKPPEPAPSGLEEVVIVTATRTETPVPKVGSAVTVIPADEMARKQYGFVLDALRGIAGIGVRRSGGPGTNVSLFTRGTDSDHTLLLIDGVQVHDPSSPAAAAALNHLRVDDVDRIEVVRGPQSTLYGSDAIGGVVNVITKTGRGKPAFSFEGEAGSFGTAAGRFLSSGGTGRIHYSVSAARTDTDGISARAGDPEEDSYRSTALSGRFGFEASDRFGL